ncbi:MULTISPECIES: folate-binding protein YgfZ [unclassified Oleiphilus]|uniref:CAF17-like 4Fe-4S cluster assembly/insertion protein YgfZ n=1 Tax=unclassified Oleiphilus TaxID=2631174 RepID=UPI0007C2EEE4|nr:MULTISPECIES: folate-binding protein YgfZ [unclassified Oleiphilus]MCH2159881.1 folate-binding protein YgfZ [Oleiphilaceae bacterium]KZY63840.1 hypothetical protein A3738_01850 [Oleiphilus sp. HI0066]KZY69258.1 hypothetical protein A3739_09290 [Oleiphilus sp. HI0067]KZY76634.1 hypothetical protein A3739_23240 [Oleiphilus sp. HI0067]KZZ61391.1 hypothetical protein A3762_14350 [Oleiphilus sp. HI0125]
MIQTGVQLPYSLIKVSGPDAEKFLQGQFSCDVTELAPLQCTYGTANSAKGRMYWLFVIARIEDGFLIKVHESVRQQGVDTLSKYKVFFKCEIETLEHAKVFGVFDESNLKDEHVLQNTNFGLTRQVDAQRQELWQLNEADAPITLDPNLLNEWYKQDCLSGIPELYPETIETFILQNLNLQDLGAVSFKKGCYTGQEIIARMKFLGKAKKRMYRFQSGQSASLLPGENIFDEAGKKLGEIVRVHTNENDTLGLAVCDIERVKDSNVAYLNSNQSVKAELFELHYNPN